MQARARCKTGRQPIRSLYPFLFCAVMVLLPLQSTAALSATTAASAPVELPKSVVLVLKLVSKTYVKPTTGVVISDDGLVLVPAAFVSAGDEIVVMDGGTDIIRNGRSSRPVKRSLSDGLAVLSVDGLARPGIILSENKLLEAHVYHLAAFPTAEKIAQGAQPLWLPVKLTKSESDGRFSVSADKPLPDISGAIVDDCGYLVGLNLPKGGPGPIQDKNYVAVLGDDLSLLFDAMQINLQHAVCGPQGVPEPAWKQPAETGFSPAPEQPVNGTDEKPGEQGAIARNSAAANDPGMGTAAPLEAPTGAAKAGSRATSILAMVPMWIWLLGAIILLASLLKLIFFLRLIRRDPQPTERQRVAANVPSSGEEPDTAPLRTAADGTLRNPVAMASAEAEIPDLDALPDGYDGLVVIAGRLGDDTAFKRFCLVDTEHFDVVIGRGDVELAIETATISRRHVRLEYDGTSLTLSDLGSGNGTFVRGIPCLPAEIMCIEPADEILLGEVRLCVQVLQGAGQ